MYKGMWKIGHTRYGFQELKTRIPALCPDYSTTINNLYSDYPRNYSPGMYLGSFPYFTSRSNHYGKSFSDYASIYSSKRSLFGGVRGSKYDQSNGGSMFRGDRDYRGGFLEAVLDAAEETLLSSLILM